MKEYHLNIVSFTIPFPANYGGVIDVYYKLAALKDLGIKIHLHCFQYDRSPVIELEHLCESIKYYPRMTGLLQQLSILPYIVKGRRNAELLRELTNNNYPILFEGLHSCYYLNHPSLIGRQLIYRESNIEHQYYYHLYRSSRNIWKRTYYLIESLKLHFFQKVLEHASLMLVVSESDRQFLQEAFPNNQIVYLPSFHGNNEIRSLEGNGKYAFYHGNLSVEENIQAADYLMNEVFNDLDIPLFIAGLNPPSQVVETAKKNGVTLLDNVSNEKMDELIREAHVNILVSFQATGLKLKLLNTLYNGRFVLVNPEMLLGTGLDELCTVAADSENLKKELKRLFTETFDNSLLEKRRSILSERYSDQKNARKLVDLIFPDFQP
jgi:hypothetical protein